MDYSYMTDTSQPFSLYDLHGLPTPDPSQAPPGAYDLIAAALNYRNNENPNSNNNNAPFDLGFGLGPNTPFAQHQQHHQHHQNPPPPHSPPESLKQSSEGNLHSQDSTGVAESLGRSSSEEKDGGVVDPNKRKAQNRAAQRAFRERKERHVKDLEQKVNDLEGESSTLHADNERLKQELARFATENEILRATSQNHPQSNPSTHPHPHPSNEPTTTGPMVYKPLDFKPSSASTSTPAKQATGTGTAATTAPHRITTCPLTGEKLLDTGATWDLIQEHELFKQGLVDIADVHAQLKKIAQCNGQGPAFPEGAVKKAIERCAEGRDGL
ncbi:hypothetical protein SI65_05605 [Aspergillus cristatus]|uniref:BZIP domain-containing protein n=1 Tax=Aspergillus cristatus TaxID=573508 RepID=A0A1E3BDL6_ASPCR|nr:hypothetical protein SI65_05605 [Aspergillus cristatus]